MIKNSDKRSSDEARKIGTLLRKLANLVEKSSEDEIKVLLRGRAQLEIRKSGPKKELADSRHRSLCLKKEFFKIDQKLSSFQTREAGVKFLITEFPKKILVEEFARFLDLPVHRTDTVETLRKKVVESRIGSRLRSEAVQGIRM